jgi:Fe-S-cluster-containing hydrogenase component 2
MMAEKGAKFGDLMKSKIVYHPEKCVGCHLCAMACSLRYEGVVNPLKARIKIVRKNNITEKIVTTPDCTRCGLCTVICNYGALELSPIAK